MTTAIRPPAADELDRPASRRGRTRRTLRSFSNFLYVVPALVLFVVFVLYPIIFIFQASLLEWNGFAQGKYVGFANYVKLFTDDRPFALALRNSFYWIFLTIFPQMFIGFFLALLLNGQVWGRNVYRAIFYMPAIISPVVIGIVWRRIYNPFGGFLSGLADVTGLSFLSQPYLADTGIAIFSVIAVNVWQWTGWSMLLYLAGLQGIDQDMLDAAAVDGVNPWQRVRHIFWPLLRHVHTTLILLGVIGALQTFALVYVMTEGGPNNATQMLPTYIFQTAFEQAQMGYASAVSVILLLVALALSIILVRFFGARFSMSA
jgi:multiple sugar transport system permease protein/raffinose/stachyose/melibiose transport system permease protein